MCAALYRKQQLIYLPILAIEIIASSDDLVTLSQSWHQIECSDIARFGTIRRAAHVTEASGTTPGVAEARNTTPISPCPSEGASESRGNPKAKEAKTPGLWVPSP